MKDWDRNRYAIEHDYLWMKFERVRRERNDYEVELLKLRELVDKSHERERELLKYVKTLQSNNGVDKLKKVVS
jgi:hypothetical protein